MIGGQAADGPSFNDIVELDQGAKLGVVHEMFVQHLQERREVVRGGAPLVHAGDVGLSGDDGVVVIGGVMRAR